MSSSSTGKTHPCGPEDGAPRFRTHPITVLRGETHRVPLPPPVPPLKATKPPPSLAPIHACVCVCVFVCLCSLLCAKGPFGAGILPGQRDANQLPLLFPFV